MPALPPVPGVIKVSLTWTDQDDLNAESHLYFGYNSASGVVASDLDALATKIASSYTTNYAAQCPGVTILTRIVATDIGSASGASVTHVVNIPGTRSQAPAPPPLCVLFNGTVNRRYRGGKPRLYFPTLATIQITSGSNIGAGDVTNFTNAMNAFILGCGITSTTGQPVGPPALNVSYFKGFSVVTNPVTGRSRNIPTRRAVPVVDQIGQYSCSPKVGIQRRRTLRRT